MLLKDAMRSLISNLGRAFFYWLTFVLTSMFIFVFFNIAMSDAIGVTFIDAGNDLSLNVTIFVIGVCMVIIFFANDFFVKNKARDLAVRLVCGATYAQLAGYLLAQTFLLLALSIAAGILLGLVMIPVLNAVMPMFVSSPFLISVHWSAVIATAVILVSIVFWTTYLNMAFAYRNSASMLLNDTKIKINFDMPKVQAGGFSPSVRTRRIFWMILFIFPMFMFYQGADGALLWSIVGLVGYNGVVKRCIVPLLNWLADHKKISDPGAIASLGFVRADLQMMRLNMILLILSSILLAAIMLSSGATELERMLSMLSYTVMNILLSFAIMFKYSSELSGRRKYFMSLSQIGYTDEDLQKIIFSETTLFYGFTLLVILLYLGNMFTAMLISGAMTASTVMILILMLVVPMIVCWAVTLYFYKKSVMAGNKSLVIVKR